MSTDRLNDAAIIDHLNGLMREIREADEDGDNAAAASS